MKMGVKKMIYIMDYAKKLSHRILMNNMLISAKLINIILVNIMFINVAQCPRNPASKRSLDTVQKEGSGGYNELQSSRYAACARIESRESTASLPSTDSMPDGKSLESLEMEQGQASVTLQRSTAFSDQAQRIQDFMTQGQSHQSQIIATQNLQDDILHTESKNVLNNLLGERKDSDENHASGNSDALVNLHASDGLNAAESMNAADGLNSLSSSSKLVLEETQSKANDEKLPGDDEEDSKNVLPKNVISRTSVIDGNKILTKFIIAVPGSQQPLIYMEEKPLNSAIKPVTQKEIDKDNDPRTPTRNAIQAAERAFLKSCTSSQLALYKQFVDKAREKLNRDIPRIEAYRKKLLAESLERQAREASQAACVIDMSQTQTDMQQQS